MISICTLLVNLLLFQHLLTISAEKVVDEDQQDLGRSESSECTSDCSVMSTCGSWFEQASVKTGSYQLGQKLELSCQFLSTPRPLDITWKFKSPVDQAWRNVSCKVETKFECNATKLGEHRTISYCIAERVSLEMNGVYRCETIDGKDSVYSSEMRIDVVGIQSVVKTSDHLHFEKPGHIEVMICSNPNAHLFWMDDQLVLQPGQSRGGFAVSTSLPARTESAHEFGPTYHIPYCYLNRIIVAKVDDRVQKLKLIASLEDDMQSVDLGVKVDLNIKVKHRHNK